MSFQDELDKNRWGDIQQYKLLSVILSYSTECNIVGVHKSEIIDILSRPALLITNTKA